MKSNIGTAVSLFPFFLFPFFCLLFSSLMGFLLVSWEVNAANILSEKMLAILYGLIMKLIMTVVVLFLFISAFRKAGANGKFILATIAALLFLTMALAP